MKQCVLYDRECIECGECNLCDLDPSKVCDNCMRCVNNGADYREIIVEDILDGVENVQPAENAIDQAALIDALNGGRLSGAALDVFAQEPIPAGDPAWTAKNLLITPHISGQMSLGYTRDRNVELFCEDLERYGRGEKPLRLVDRKIGY